MKFSEDKLKKMSKDELFNFAKIIGVKYSAKASKEEIVALLLGLKIEKEPKENKSEKTLSTDKKKRGRPSKAEKAAKVAEKPAKKSRRKTRSKEAWQTFKS